jgi:hypothetical protein
MLLTLCTLSTLFTFTLNFTRFTEDRDTNYAPKSVDISLSPDLNWILFLATRKIGLVTALHREH